MNLKLILVVAFLLIPVISLRAGEIGFDESFSLSDDRQVPLKQLIPGTEEYYYYNCIQLLNQREFQKVQDLFGQWVNRYGYTEHAQEVQNRDAMLEYEISPDKAKEHLRNKLNLTFAHQKQLLKPITKFPTAVPQSAISWETLSSRAFSEYRDLSGFTPHAHLTLLGKELDSDRRRHLLSMLQRPEGEEGLARLIVEDLKFENSGGFGSLEIHSKLLLSQLEECRRLMPQLLTDTNFINAVIAKLQPGADIDWRNDSAEKEAYLGRLWKFVKDLPPAHNSLKAHVLYHWLSSDQSKGIYDRKKFMEYLELPRPTNYMNPKYLERENLRYNHVNLSADYMGVTQLPVIGDDEPLVRDFLREFLRSVESYREFSEYVESNYLKDLFAETKIVFGIGNLERWFSLLNPARVKDIKERIELDFRPTCKESLTVQDPISFEVAVKNVPQLIVKIYRINTLAYYREKQQEVGTDLDLDGLVPNEERVFPYQQPEYIRHIEKFEFPQLSGPGVFVIDLIGNGRSSRALVRKGRLTFMQRLGAAGHVFTIFDENNTQVKEAALWLGAHEYKADEQGEIVVPFSSQPGKQKIILTQGEFASLNQFEHFGEDYSLSAGFYVDRESLVEGAKATVLVRPWLTVNGVPIDMSLFLEPTLVISTVDIDGVAASKEIRDFKLQNASETAYEFKVPEKLAQITFTLRGKVENLSRQKKEDFTTSRSYSLNGINKTEKIEDMLVRHIDGQYIVELRGKTGESKADRPINLELRHRDFTRAVNLTLQTDASGRVNLGELDGIDQVTMQGPEGISRTWSPSRDECAYPPIIHGLAGSPIQVPLMLPMLPTAPDRKDGKGGKTAASLFEIRNGTYVNSFSGQLAIRDGFLMVDDLPAGDFELVLHPDEVVIQIRLTKGKKIGSWLISRDRCLQARTVKPLHITSVESDNAAKKVVLHLANVIPTTRVHVLAARFQTTPVVWNALGFCDLPGLSLTRLSRPLSRYLSGRAIGDEYRYILERKFARIFAGNMLARPSLLLNPWSLRKTDTGKQDAQGGDAWGRVAEPEPTAPMESKAGSTHSQASAGEGDYSEFDYLPEPSLLLSNLKPEADGTVSIPMDKLGSRQQLHILAVDLRDAVYREISLPYASETVKDLRMSRSLDAQKHFSEQKNISLVASGQAFTIEDITTAKIEVYDSLASVYRLLTTLNADPNMAEFGFILNWPNMKQKEKQTLYSKYACHELNFFLFKKDPKFFAEVIKPYLKNKEDKTFLDRWLLDDDLQSFLQPWSYGRLNVVERILLARHIQGEGPATARLIKELNDMIPPNPERFNQLFDTAVKGSALETDDRLGFEKAANAISPKAMLPSKLMSMSAPACPPPPPPAASMESAFADDESMTGGRGGAADRPMPAKKSRMAGLKKMARRSKADSKEELSLQATRSEADAVGVEEERLDGKLAMAKDNLRRQEARQLFRQLEKTEEWVENNYWHLPIERHFADLITVNSFWSDFAAAPADKPFLSTNIAEASRNFPEMMFALAVLDLPFTSGEQKAVFEGPRMRITPTTDVVLFHKEIKPVTSVEKTQTILTGQNFYAQNDRYRYENNERFDKFVTEEFQTHRVYGCQVVLTNPTSARRKVEVLLQIPEGSIPVLNGFFTRSTHVQIEPFSTQTVEYAFYFPFPGKMRHYPVHIAENGKLIAANDPFVFNVVDEPTRFDTTSWQYISQNGSDDDVLKYLAENNIQRLDLLLIAFRMREKGMFLKVTDLLRARHVYNDTLWSYGLYHNLLPTLREYLPHTSFADKCGSTLVSAPLTLDPVARFAYQHREYWPLVNARVYQLGQKRKILNEQFSAQYQALLSDLRYRSTLSDVDRMAVVYYLLLQDRVEEGEKFFAAVKDPTVVQTMQYQYFKAYLDFSQEKIDDAVAIAKQFAEYPVDRWRNLFGDILAQASEIQGKPAQVNDQESRDQAHNKLASTEPSLEFQVENRQITLRFQNLKSCAIKFYLMDLELLFSRNPFVQEVGGQFSVIHPNATMTVELPAGQNTLTIDLPEKLRDSNVMTEVEAGALVRNQAYYPHSLNVQMIENYGQLRVAHARTGAPLPKVYVKVYAKMKDGQVTFYKDGYTDLRGKFDYSALSTNQLDQAARFSILIMSEKNGAVVREAAPPKR